LQSIAQQQAKTQTLMPPTVAGPMIWTFLVLAIYHTSTVVKRRQDNAKVQHELSINDDQKVIEETARANLDQLARAALWHTLGNDGNRPASAASSVTGRSAINQNTATLLDLRVLEDVGGALPHRAERREVDDHVDVGVLGHGLSASKPHSQQQN
jgi:DNA uptake protein ComE-like DNA-binding protein